MAVRYTLSASDYFSDELRTALRRRLSEIIGAGLLLVAGLCALALATWSVQDPSLSHATNAPVRNMLGLTGAIGADLMMQLFGIATIALLLPIAAWGWRLMTHRTLLLEVWGPGYEHDKQVLRVHMANLRGKIERPGRGRLIHTDPGVGYRLDG